MSRLLIVLLCAAMSGCAFFLGPNVGPVSKLSVPVNRTQLDRGEYLAKHITVCLSCHSQRDWNKFSGPIIKGTEGQGGHLFSKTDGIPGEIYAPNITPYALASWTDGEILRAITEGINQSGQAMFPVMPYAGYSKLTHSDANAIILYLRTLRPVHRKTAPRKLNFPMNFLVNLTPKKAEPTLNMLNIEEKKQGEYLAKIAGCDHCHTPLNNLGHRIDKLSMAGGMEFNMQGSIVRAANISPDSKTGIGAWSKKRFISLFVHRGITARGSDIDDGEFNSPMPWSMYEGMTDEDLGAIYSYLQSIKPIKNVVQKYTPQYQ